MMEGGGRGGKDAGNTGREKEAEGAPKKQREQRIPKMFHV